MSQAGDVPARSRQTGDKPGADRIETGGHNDGDGGGRLHGRDRYRIEPGNDNIHAKPDKVCRKGGQPFHLGIREAVLDDDILANAVAKVPHTFFERINGIERLLPGRDRLESDPVDPSCRLLRPRGQRPRRRRATKKRDELASLHVTPNLRRRHHLSGRSECMDSAETCIHRWARPMSQSGQTQKSGR